jgi:hypothetical protein
VSFVPTLAGTRWYHTHAMAMDDVAKGAYTGSSDFSTSSRSTTPGRYDQEIFLASRHWEPRIIHRGDPQNDWTVDYASALAGRAGAGPR